MTAWCISKGYWPMGHVLWLDMGPFEEQLFCEASQENSHKARARMLQAEGIRVPGSKEASFFRRFYRIPFVGFSPFGWERGLVYYCLLEICRITFFLHLCQLSYAWTISRQILQGISVLSNFSLILSRVSLWGQPHVSAFYTFFLLLYPTFGKTNVVLRFFSIYALQPSVKANFNFNKGVTRMGYAEAHPQSRIRHES